MRKRMGGFLKPRKWTEISFLPALMMMVLFFIINCIITKNFLSFSYLISLVGNNAPLILISLGVAVVILGGGIDIAQGSLITVLNVIFVTLAAVQGMDFRAAAVLIIMMGMAVGAINGIIISVFKVPALLATFSMTFVLDGLSYWIMPMPQGGMPGELVAWYHSKFLSVPMPVIILFITVFLWILIKKSPIGTWILAFGNHSGSAYVSGVPVHFTQIFTYMFAGLLGGIAAFAMTSNTGSGDALLAQGMSLQAVAACVIGGLSLNGGRGSLAGAFMGAVFLFLTSTMVYSLKVNIIYQDLIEAVIILVGVIGSVLINRAMAQIKTKREGELNG